MRGPVFRSSFPQMKYYYGHLFMKQLLNSYTLLGVYNGRQNRHCLCLREGYGERVDQKINMSLHIVINKKEVCIQDGRESLQCCPAVISVLSRNRKGIALLPP